MNRQPAILIVDDDPDICSMLEFYFENLEYAVHVARRGAAAVRIAREARPDVILLDVRLPDSDGFTVARALRADRYTQHIPIIFLTGRNEPPDRVEALEAGADDFVTKPFDAQELRLRIERVLKSRR
ncbi:MAG TPA: response regulator [Anaerolineae bacterium]|nr:response regulator [Anaerolineae bacterium]